MSLKKRILINIGSNWANTFVSAIVGLVLVPVMLTSLGKQAYGVWALLAFGLSFPQILENAFATTVNRFVAYHRQDAQMRNQIISLSFLILLCLGLFLLILSIILSFFVTDWFSAIPAEYAAEAQITCILVGLTFLMKVLECSFSGALRGYELYVHYNVVVICSNVLRAVGTIILLQFWKNIIGVQLVFFLTYMISAVLMVWMAARNIPQIRIRLSCFDKLIFRELWSFTSHSIARSGSRIVLQNVLMLLVGWKGSSEDVTAYSIAFRLPAFFRGFLVGSQTVFLPAITRLCSQGLKERINDIVKKAFRINCAVTMFVCILFFTFADLVLRLWLHGNVPDNTLPAMRILILATIPHGVFDLWQPVLVAVGYLRGITIAVITATISTIVLALALLYTPISITLVPAIALLVITWLVRGLWIPWMGIRELHIRSMDMWKTSLHQPVCAAMAGICLVLFWNWMYSAAYIPYLVYVAATTVMVGLCFLCYPLREETRQVLSLIGRKFHRRRL